MRILATDDSQPTAGINPAHQIAVFYGDKNE